MPTIQLDGATIAMLFSALVGILPPLVRWWNSRRKAELDDTVEIRRMRDASTVTAAEQWRDIAERMESKWQASEARIQQLETDMRTMNRTMSNLNDAFEYLAREVESTHGSAVSIARAKAAGRWPVTSPEAKP